MPGLHIELTESEYDKIPKPKRRWVLELVRESLKMIDHVEKVSEPKSTESDHWFYFRVGNNILKGSGPSPAAAARKLGITTDPLSLDWTDEAGAIEAGWVNMLDV